MAALSKLVQWLPKAVEASADDIKRFGPNAARVRSLLDFLPGISDEAARVSSDAWEASRKTGRLGKAMNDMSADVTKFDWNNPVVDAPLMEGYRQSASTRAFQDTSPVVRYLDEAGETIQEIDAPWFAADAGEAEAVADIISRNTYDTMVSPLAAGRAVDLLRARPRYQGTPFLETVQNLATRGAITGPRDVVRAGRITQQPEDVRDLALELISSGVDINKALPIARRIPPDIIETMKVFLREGMNPETAETIARAV